MILKSKKTIVGGTVIIGIIAIASIVILYTPQPTNNPFDPVFNVFPYTLKKQGYVQEPIECGYSNYYKSVPYGRIYYQVFLDEPFIVAKGGMLLLDTICKACVENTKLISDTSVSSNGEPLIYHYTEGWRMWNEMGDSLMKIAETKNIKAPALFKFDTVLVRQRLKPFEVSVIDTSIKVGDYSYEFLVKHLPTDSLFYCSLEFDGNGAREIQIFTINPQPLYEKPVISFFLNLFKEEEEEPIIVEE